MAERYLVASGSVLDPANLDGGTALQVGDQLFANGFTGDIDGTTPALDFISINAGTVAVSGGAFDLIAGAILNADVAGASVNASNGVVRASSGNSTINGNIQGGNGSGGNIRIGLYVNGASVTVNGKITGGSGLGNTNAPTMSGCRLNSGFLTVTDVEGGASYNDSLKSPYGVWNSNGQLTITGTATSATCEAVAGSCESVAIVESTSSTVNVFRGSGNSVGGNVIVTDRIILNKGQRTGFTSSLWEFSGTPTIEITFDDDSTATLTDGTESANYPSETDVEEGVVYGNLNQFTGTMKILDPVDFASSFAEELRTTTEPELVRIRTCATDDSVGNIVTSTLGAP